MKKEPKNTPAAASEITAAVFARAVNKDKEALETIYEATCLEVYRTARAMVRDEDLALDIQQDTYVHAFTHLDQLRDPEKLLPWLRRIAVNETRAYFRRRKEVLFTELDDGEGESISEFSDISPDASPELSLDRKETRRLFREITDQLPDGQRLIIGMYYYEQMSVKEISELLNISPGSVRVQLLRGRKRLEQGVRQLEQRGVKLYGLSPLPFAAALLRRLAPAEAGEKKVLAGALEKSGAAVVLQAGKPFFETVLGRVLIGAALAAAVGGGVAGYRWYQNHSSTGDYQPPTKTVLLLHEDTDEDLIPDPTEPVIEPSEPTDPEEPTAPEEPIEPAPTEPAVTEPEVTQPYYIEPPATEPPVTQPPVTEPPVTEPPVPDAPLDPIGEPPDPFSQPTEPSPTEPVTLNHRIVNCSWGELDSLYDQPWGSVKYLEVVTEDGAAPTVYTDNEAVVSLKSEGYILSASNDRQRTYYWEVTFLGPGTARVYCVYNDVVAKVFSVTNPDHPDEILSVQVNETVNPTELSLSKGQVVWLYVAVQGKQLPEVSSDNPEVLGLQNQQTLHDGNSAWYRTLYGWQLSPNDDGIANITITINGKIVYNITVTVNQQSWSNTNSDVVGN